MSPATTPCAASASRAPCNSGAVTLRLNRDTTIPNRSPRPSRDPVSSRGMRSRSAGLQAREQMPQLLLLGAQVREVAAARRHFERNALGHLDAVPLQAEHFPR